MHFINSILWKCSFDVLGMTFKENYSVLSTALLRPKSHANVSIYVHAWTVLMYVLGLAAQVGTNQLQYIKQLHCESLWGFQFILSEFQRDSSGNMTPSRWEWSNIGIISNFNRVVWVASWIRIGSHPHNYFCPSFYAALRVLLILVVWAVIV